MGKARELAEELNVCVGAVLLGDDTAAALSDALIAQGADKVYCVTGEKLSHYQTASYTRVVCDLIEQYKPQIFLYGATAIGRDLAPTVASQMKCGLTADCTDLQIGEHKQPASDIVHENLLLQIRPAFGGNIIATIVNYDRWPQMATVREGVMPMVEPDSTRKGEVIASNADLDDFQLPLDIIESVRQEKSVDLKGARIIVAGGAGVGSEDNFKQLWDLANCLGAAVGGTRAAIDLGFIGHDHQIGQTGTTVRPALYIAAGISGAIQHVAGMDESAKILAINSDPEAPIFQVAHMGIVGDLNVVIPKLIKAIRSGASIEKAAS